MKQRQTAFYKLCMADALVRLMRQKDYDAIGVSEICEVAGVGRTTFYRHMGGKAGKDDLLLFKVTHGWERYQELHGAEVAADRGLAMSRYIYGERELFGLLHEKGLTAILLRAFELLMDADEVGDGDLAYLMAFFTYGYFGIVYQWIRRGFDETPEQVKEHVDAALGMAERG